MFVTPTVFFKFGRPAVEKYLQSHREKSPEDDGLMAACDTAGATAD
jgi:hypothetical protein